MKAVLLVAGQGSRLRPFTFSNSKEMIKFSGKPLLHYQVDSFLKHNIKDFIIVCNDHNLEEVKAYLSKAFKANFEFAVQHDQKGPAHAINCAEEFLKNTEFFIMKYADSFFTHDLVGPLISKFEEDKTDAVFLVRKVKDTSRYGILKLNGEKVTKIVEKPESNPPSNLALMGLAILNTELFFTGFDSEGLEKKEVPPPDYVLRAGGNVSYIMFEGERVDLGKPKDILTTSKMVLKNQGRLAFDKFAHKDALIDESDVSGKVGKNSKIINSVIMDKAFIGKNCTIENSVIGEGAVVEDNVTIIKGNGKVWIKDKLETEDDVGAFIGPKAKVKENLKLAPGTTVYPFRTLEKDESKITKAVIFDLDNTLVNTSLAAKKATLETMKLINKENPDSVLEEWTNIVKELKTSNNPKERSRKHSFKVLTEKLQKGDPEKMYGYFYKVLKDNLILMDNVENILQRIPCKKAIMTNSLKELAIMKLEKFNLTDFFDVIVTPDDVGSMKPDKKYLDLTLKKLNVQAKDCIAIGDSYERDLQEAESRGAETVLINKDSDLLKVLKFFS